jgi:uncharacterized protein YdaU (DUF1376 family)
MHYYQFNIADYRKDTYHLTPIEHYIYRTLIDWYYLDEQPIPKITQVVSRRLGLGSDMEPNISNVLKDFFIEHENGWHHKRIDQEINEYHNQCDKNKTNGKLGGRPKKTQVVTSGNPKLTEANPTITLTTNYKPLTTNQVNSVTNVTGGEPPKITDPEEIIFGYGLTMLVAAGTPDKNARSFLGGLRKGYGDAALVDKLRECAKAKPLQPVEWLAAAMPPGGAASKIPKPDNFAEKNYGSEITAL